MRNAVASAQRLLVVAAVLCLFPALSLLAGSARAAEGIDRLGWTANINGQNVDNTSADDPIELDPSRRAEFSVIVNNPGSEKREVAFVRLRGRVLGLSFYVLTTRIDLVAEPGEQPERAFDVDLLDLGSQANGLIPSRISLLDDDGVEITGKDLQVDVRGKPTSVYTVFGVAVGGMALVLLGAALWRLAHGTLHANRWRRALTFAAPGLGLGFLLTFTLSTLRIASPQAGLWTILCLGGAAIGFAAGYLSPNPGVEDESADAEDTLYDDASTEADGAPVESSDGEGIDDENFVIDTRADETKENPAPPLYGR